MVSCPYANLGLDEGNRILDTSVTSIVTDLMNIGASSFPANAFSQQACVRSNFTVSCGAATANPAIPAGGNTFGWAIGDLSAWTNDSGHAYAYISYVRTTSTPVGIVLEGVFISGND
jgi:hypothetical protein